jgi:hypothetical protein
MSMTWRRFWSHALGWWARVDEWQAERVAQIGLEADRRREEHRGDAAAALARIRGRGESIAALAKLANISEGEVRSYLKSEAAARRAASAATAGDAPGRPAGSSAVPSFENGYPQAQVAGS